LEFWQVVFSFLIDLPRPPHVGLLNIRFRKTLFFPPPPNKLKTKDKHGNNLDKGRIDKGRMER